MGKVRTKGHRLLRVPPCTLLQGLWPQFTTSPSIFYSVPRSSHWAPSRLSSYPSHSPSCLERRRARLKGQRTQAFSLMRFNTPLSWEPRAPRL